MTEQELREKIVKIALNTSWTDMFGDHYSMGESAANAIADALIAAGIGDVKEAEHRTFVMQLALKNACEIVFSQEIDDEDWDDVIFNYKKEKGIREIGITPNILYDYLKEQAEKELAEGNGGKKKV